MEAIKNLPPMERPREKLRYQGPEALGDAELLTILFGSGSKGLPVSVICENLVQAGNIGQMDVDALCKVKGIGEAKALLLLAAVELGNRLHKPERLLLKNDTDIYYLLRPVLKKITELQYILVLLTAERELLAMVEASCVLPEIAWILEMATEAGAKRLTLARNGWMQFSNAEGRFLSELVNAAGMVGITVQGMMAVGNERYKML